MNAQDSQMQTSMGNIEAYSGPGDYVSPVEVHPTMFPLSPAPLLPHPEYLHRNQCVIPVHISPTAAHQPIPPEQHSTYSELAPHLEFMAKMQQQELSPQPIDAPTRKARQPSRLSPRARNHRQSTYPSPIERSRRLERRSGSSDILVENKSRVPRSRYASLPPSEREPNQESSDASEVCSTSSKNRKEPKRPSLACTFCRERKIACNRVEDGIDSDTPCKACALRSFNCVFVHKSSKVNERTRT
ncbi:hypothetical protein M413DRAFT_449296 [Hebeloma cylindrosporum]|uniref:Zn(2)-C6 fungal-type domain-containing protein n=1 Tax=Hebeloma cylindrosporum TaxID=76867 RepID=A0A0C3BVZ7_HEBCY|nr:hypothetical protein M413DRAFT_449296 [Hebeloma cylindrosporum h7]